jgi:biotin transport system substrate-specific component
MNGFLHSEALDQWRTSAFKKRAELSLPVKLGLALLMAALTGLAAQVRFPVPGTLVPVTGQVFAVLLSGVLLGGVWGGISQILYVGLGAAGVPWFTGMAGGVPLGPTAGYLMGFVVAASMIGWINDRFPLARHFVFQLTLMIWAVVVIYAFGAAVYAIFTGMGFSATMQQAVLPFISFDLWKAFGAAIVASALLPKERTDG